MHPSGGIQEDDREDLSIAAQLKSTLAYMKESSGQETGESGRRAGALAAPTLAEESQDQNCAYGSVMFQLFRPAGHEMLCGNTNCSVA